MLNKTWLSKYGLKYNPFEPRNYSDLQDTFVDRARSCERAISVIENAIRQNSSKSVAIIGENGFGKTAILKKIEFMINSKEFARILIPQQSNNTQSVEQIIDRLNQFAEIKSNMDELRSIVEARSEMRLIIANLRNYVFEDLEHFSKFQTELNSLLQNILRLKIITKSDTEISEIKVKENYTFNKYKNEALPKLAILLDKINQNQKEKRENIEDQIIWMELKTELKTDDIDKILGLYYLKLTDLKELKRFKQFQSQDQTKIEALINKQFIIINWKPLPNEVKNIESLLKTLIEHILTTLENTRLQPKTKDIFFGLLKIKIQDRISKPQILEEFKRRIEKITKESKTKTGLKLSFLKMVDCYVELEEKAKVDHITSLSKVIESLLLSLVKHFGLIVFIFDDADVFAGKKKKDIRYKLNKLLDLNIPIVCYYAIPWTNKIKTQYSGLLDGSLDIDLHSREMFKDKDFMNFILAKLMVARFADLKPHDPFHPFTKQSIRLIFENTMKIPLYVEYVCRECVELLRETNETIVNPDLAREGIREGWSWIWKKELRPVEQAILLKLAEIQVADSRKIAEELELSRGFVSRAVSSLDRKKILMATMDKINYVTKPGTKYSIRFDVLKESLSNNPDSFS